MAHMDQEKKAVIKTALDKVLKARGFKYSLRVDNHMAINCTIQSGPIDFIGNMREHLQGDIFNTGIYTRGHMPVNLYWINEHFTGEAAAILKECRDALQAAGYYDNSNAQIDYFDTAYYMHLNVGAWNKPYKITAPTMRQIMRSRIKHENAIKARILAQGCSADVIDNQLIIKVLG
jgi:hypothetical protein